MTDTVVSPNTLKRTIGEELYLVHLQRQQHHHHEKQADGDKEPAQEESSSDESEDDHDYEKPRKRSRSIGEELFAVHLKRSQGMEPDYDLPKTEDVKEGSTPKKESSTTEAGDSQEGTSEDPGVMHLRNRDVPVSSH